MRIINRVLPFVYEARCQENVRQWEREFLWTRRENSPPLAEQLIDTCMNLLFYSGFTVARSTNGKNNGAETGNSKIVYSIWETGVGSSTPMPSSHELVSNRVEMLRLLLALSSDCIYTPLQELASRGSPYLTYMVTREDKRLVMSLLCSLLNVTMKYSPGWKVPYDHMLLSDRNRQLVTYSLQYLELLLMYPLPVNESTKSSDGSDSGSRNWFRYYASKIHRTQDLQFIADSVQRLLTQPIQVSTSYLPGSHLEVEWITELTMLFWDLIQSNKKFKAYMIASSRVHDFTIILLYYLLEYRSNSARSGLVRLCAYVLLYLSANVEYAQSLSKQFEGQGALPSSAKVPAFNGTYGDYMIIQLLKLVSTGGDSLVYLLPTFLDCIYNISPYIQKISYLTSSSFIQLLSAASSPSFFMANDTNQMLLDIVLKTLNLLMTSNFQSNRNLVYNVYKNEALFKQLQGHLEYQLNPENNRSNNNSGTNSVNNSNNNSTTAFAIDSDDEAEKESAKADQYRKVKKKLTAKVKGKLPATGENQDLNYIESSWMLVDRILALINAVKKELGGLGDSHAVPHAVIEAIGKIDKLPGLIEVDVEKDWNFEPLKFVWNDSSLGWYASILWGSIFEKENQVARANSPVTVLGSHNLNVGVWNGTDIKLFRVQEVAPSGPSITRPKGAVDAVADTMIQKFGQLTAGAWNSRGSEDSSDPRRRS